MRNEVKESEETLRILPQYTNLMGDIKETAVRIFFYLCIVHLDIIKVFYLPTDALYISPRKY